MANVLFFICLLVWSGVLRNFRKSALQLVTQMLGQMQGKWSKKGMGWIIMDSVRHFDLILTSISEEWFELLGRDASEVSLPWNTWQDSTNFVNLVASLQAFLDLCDAEASSSISERLCDYLNCLTFTMLLQTLANNPFWDSFANSFVQVSLTQRFGDCMSPVQPSMVQRSWVTNEAKCLADLLWSHF